MWKAAQTIHWGTGIAWLRWKQPPWRPQMRPRQGQGRRKIGGEASSLLFLPSERAELPALLAHLSSLLQRLPLCLSLFGGMEKLVQKIKETFNNIDPGLSRLLEPKMRQKR